MRVAHVMHMCDVILHLKGKKKMWNVCSSRYVRTARGDL